MIKQSRYDEAIRWLQICTELGDKGIRDHQTHRKSKISALLQWAKLEASRGQHLQAIQLYRRALESRSLITNQLQVGAF